MQVGRGQSADESSWAKGMGSGLASSIVCAVLSLASLPVAGFPPYRSTDADTAGAGELQLRLGLIRLQRESSETERTTPLLRANLGVGEHFEVITELEYSPDRHQLDEGALGFKWARAANGFAIGLETLALLPVRSDQGGSGIESQLVATREGERWQVHINAGGFYDARGADTERGWRASVLAELPRERLQPGFELFAKRGRSEATRVQAGVGIIARLPRIEIRSGLHLGLTDEAPDLEASIWLAKAWRVGGSSRE